MKNRQQTMLASPCLYMANASSNSVTTFVLSAAGLPAAQVFRPWLRSLRLSHLPGC